MAAARRQDAVHDFLTSSGCVRFRSTGYVSVVTADGETLAIVNPTSHRQNGLHAWLGQRLDEWQALPDQRRRPGAIEVPDLEQVDPNFAALTLPEGALVLRVTNRTLQRDDSGTLRYLCAEDLEKETSDTDVERIREPANDFMWILEDEWRALVPEPGQAQVGQVIVAPEALTRRLYGHQLNPNLGIQGSRAFSPRSLESGELTITVVEVGADTIRLRLEGAAVLDAAGGMDTRLVYRPAVFGHATYDRAVDAFTGFELVAFGELTGRLHRSPETLFSEQPRWLGVAFELIPEPRGAEMLRPNAARMSGSRPLAGLENYLAP